eukprot:gb/GFBE01025911.1/.p1 GENE.gb/GFBE01025911.1/~~gb/GFBE01025911.1/.p1  ORF type:complete len:303 (+),score=81.22 gb/GFBE01025911.1/:1-909(+)
MRSDPFASNSRHMDGVTLAKQRAKLHRASSLKEHREHFDAIIKGSMDDVRGLLQELADAVSLLKDMKRGKQDMALEMLMVNLAHSMQRMMDRYIHRAVETNWSQLDSNKDGTLDKDELRRAVRAILMGLEGAMDNLVSEAMGPAIQELEGWIEHDSVGPIGFAHGMDGIHLAMEANSKARVSNAANKLSKLYGVMLQALVNKSNPIADELFEVLDVNNDGKVSKSEFLDGFCEAMGPVLDFSRIVKQLVREKSSASLGLGRSSSKLLGGENDVGGFLWGIGFTVLMGAMVYQAFTFRMRKPQ